MIKFRLKEYTVPSLNRLLRTHWAKRQAQQRMLEWEIMAEVGKRENPPEILRVVEIISYRKSLLDYDNLLGGTKQLVDALKHLNYIKDDSPDWMFLKVSQVRTRKEKGTEVRIT